jgi:phospho-N-acetylmuramoyl-pentapeptide-transferase
MFSWALERLAISWPGHVEALDKITFRAALAAGTAFLLALLLGPRLIAWLGTRFREPIKSDSAEVCRLHQAKHATPTMGGLFIIAGLIGALLVFGRLTSPPLQAALVVALGLAAVGAVDDLVKLRGTANGISARAKLVGQLLVCTVAATLLYHHYAGLPGGLLLRVPLVGVEFSLGVWFIPWAVLVMVGASNAVNLTDGLDGLAGGSLIFATAAMTLAAYAAGHAEWAAYLNLPRVSGAGELTLLGAALIGGTLGFLWFNCHPAQVFMGDTGALPLGGLLGLLAVAARQELLLLVVGGVFVAEAASVILQVGWYKCTGRRMFRCAPLHHHFQFQGWPETRIVVRFWIASALCALVGLAGLKVQVHERGMTHDEVRMTKVVRESALH